MTEDLKATTLESRLQEAERRAEEAEALQANLRNMINAADETIRKLNGRIVAVESAERQLSELRAENERMQGEAEKAVHIVSGPLKDEVARLSRLLKDSLAERDTLKLQVAGLRDKASLLCAEMELSLPDTYGDLNLENVWAAYQQVRQALASTTPLESKADGA